MERENARKSVVVSGLFTVHRKQIYEYGLDTFGYFQAERYAQQITQALSTLPCHYTMYPECRYLATKSRKYRQVILDAHLIIYRITEERVEVLDILHSASGIRKIRQTRNVRL